jgi:tetratricopeptide (TPR) repeat protein
VLLAEVLAASAAVLVAVRGWLWCVPACAAAALAASAQPGFTMVILCAATLASPSERGRTLSLAGAALLGVMAWWFAAPGASLPGAAWCAIDQLLRPGAVGLAHLAADPWWASAGAAALLALMVASWRQRAMAPVACLLFALLAWAASAGLRPPRTGLEYLGVGATPDAWLPLLLLLHAALAALACGTRWSTLPLWLAAALAVGGGFMHGRRFDPPLQLIDHSVAVEPRSAELEVLRAQIELAQGGAMPREASRAFAAAALERVREVLTSRRGEPAARTLEVMALASMARLDVARQCSDRLLAAFPDDWRGRAARAELEAIAGDRLAALRWMRSALAVSGSPELRASVTRLTDEIYGEIRHELAERRWSEARKLADALRGIAPEELPAHEAYVDTFSLAGEWPQALAAAEEHFVRHPRSAGAARRVAVIHQRLGHDAAAAQHDRLAQELAAADGPP